MTVGWGVGVTGLSKILLLLGNVRLRHCLSLPLTSIHLKAQIEQFQDTLANIIIFVLLKLIYQH